VPDINPNQRVYDVVQAIHQGRYRIPNIQRGYEWDQARVTKLLDSIMSGYPIGAIMVWLPDEEMQKEIPTRRFVGAFSSSLDYLTNAPHPADDEAHLVLDGQQRLQSLYLAFQGSYDNERVYLRIDHIPSDEGSDTDYGFEFLTVDEAKARPEMIHLAELIQLDVDVQVMFARELARKLTAGITDPDERSSAADQTEITINRNINRFRQQFNVRTSLLFQEVEKHQTYDHVLEIFERVNSGGMILDKSDLLFSTLKLRLAEMEARFADAVNFLNQGGRHSFNTDFLIKASLVVFDQRAKYEVVKLKNDVFIRAMRDQFDVLYGSMRQMSAWLEDEAKIKSGRFLRTRSALIPILDYMMLSGQRDKPDGENSQAMTEYLYMAFFQRLFSRATDSVLDALHTLMIDAVKDDPRYFPIRQIREFMEARLGQPYRLEDHFFVADADLVLNIVDGGVLQIDPTDPSKHSKDLKLEVDHIFPRSELQKCGMGDVADHIGNYRLIVMPANRRKLAKMPNDQTSFFGRHDPDVELYYELTLDELGREAFLAFRDARATLIRSCVKNFLRLPNSLAAMGNG
jgi:hypothetical protein